MLPPVPERIKWSFNEREKAIARRRTAEAYNVEDAWINFKHLLILAKDPKLYFSGEYATSYPTRKYSR